MRKRLLVLTPRFPFPVLGGDKLRIVQVARALSSRFELSLLSLCETKDELTVEPAENIFSEVHRIYLPKWRSYINSLGALAGHMPLQVAYYRSREFALALDSLMSKHDAVLAHLIRTGHYLRKYKHIPRILEMTDAISLNYSRLGKLRDRWNIKRMIYMLEKKRLYEYERHVTEDFDLVWLISDIDKHYLGLERDKHVRVVPAGVELSRFRFLHPSGGNVIAFIGNMVSVQNQDACHYFIDQILPLIRRHIDVSFRIIGYIPDRISARFSSYPHVTVTGRVDNVGDHIQDVFCAVCPVRAGAGMQNKVLEYLALGLPCITSTVGLEGIEAEHGRHILVYRDPEAASDFAVSLYRDSELRISLAQNGRALIEARYDRCKIDGLITGNIEDLFSSPAETKSDEL